jgi:hypothetical protein
MLVRSHRHRTTSRIHRVHHLHNHRRGRLHSSNHFTFYHGARKGHSLKRVVHHRHRRAA